MERSAGRSGGGDGGGEGDDEGRVKEFQSKVS